MAHLYAQNMGWELVTFALRRLINTLTYLLTFWPKLGGMFTPRCLLILTLVLIIGGGSYWAGRAAARPLFCLCGPPIGLARPLLAT